MKASFYTSLFSLKQLGLLASFCCLILFTTNTIAQSNDVGIIAIYAPDSGCEVDGETIEVTLFNFGTNPQSLIPFRFNVNGETSTVMQPTDGLYTGVLGPDSMVTIPFETTYDFSADGLYTIASWTELGTDMDMTNDTFLFQVENIEAISSFPYISNFDNSQESWYIDEEISQFSTWAFGTPQGTILNSAASGTLAWVTNLSGNHANSELSYIVSPCMDFSNFSEDPTFTCSVNYITENCCDGGWLEGTTDGGATWNKIGAVGSGTNWYNNSLFSAGDVWGGDSQGWQIAQITLDGYMGLTDVGFRFVYDSDGSVLNEGLAIDDISITGCLESFNVSSDVVNPSDDTAVDGMITIIPNEGLPPFSYTWSNGSTTDSTTNLTYGDYTVTIEDALGCTDEISFTLGVGVATKNLAETPLISLSPNPTSGLTILDLDFHQTVDFSTKVINSVGQTVLELAEMESNGGQYPLDLSGLSTGVYFIQILVDGKQSYAERLIKM